MTSLPNSTDEYYFNWLRSIIGSGEDRKWESTLRMLYYFTFRSFVPNDENRGADGLELRKLFEKETGMRMKMQEFNRPCSVLEMLIALAQKMSFLTTFDPADDDVDEIINNFWLMVSNLGLKPYQRAAANNAEKIENFLGRNYLRDGTGGIFPLHNPRLDQREVELWYQMQEYISTKLF